MILDKCALALVIASSFEATNALGGGILGRLREGSEVDNREKLFEFTFGGGQGFRPTPKEDWQADIQKQVDAFLGDLLTLREDFLGGDAPEFVDETTNTTGNFGNHTGDFNSGNQTGDFGNFTGNFGNHSGNFNSGNFTGNFGNQTGNYTGGWVNGTNSTGPIFSEDNHNIRFEDLVAAFNDTNMFNNGTFPGFNGTFPGFNGTFPGFNGTFPGFNGTFPRFNGTFPGFNGTFPGFNGTFPGFNGTFPGFNGTFPGFNGTFPGFNGTGSNSSQPLLNGTVLTDTMAGRRLGTFYRNELNYIRVDDEAVDLRLSWHTDQQLVGGRDRYLINPGMLFVDNEDGTTDWVRTVRYHSTGGYSNGVTTYEGQPVNEGVWVYFTAILLASEKYTGDLSGGFDDASIAKWGLQTGGSLFTADNHMLSNEDTYHVWEDICEAEPGLIAEKHVLTRKQTTGAEDPKLFVLPASMNERSRWAVTFSSYPPVHTLEGVSSLEDCKWSEYSKFQMYVAPGGEQLAHGIDTPAHRLSCGSTTDHEKNWIAFDYEDELYYVQNVQPHVVVKVNGEDGSCEKVFETSSPFLEALSERVSVRGSATALRYSEDEYIALLHTHDDFSREPYTTRAYTFEAFPPFRVLRVSKPLKLQSAGLAFASSLTAYKNKFMVGYGVADRESRVMVMSRDYLEDQFKSDCDGAVDRLVGLSGETCAEKVISLMLGEEMMPPRRAMNTVGMSHMECRGLLDHRQCEPEMVLKVSRHNKATNCNEAFSRVSGGVSCSARIKYIIQNTDKSPEEAFRVVAEEFKVCRDVVSLGCTEDDLHYPETTCKPTLFNQYDTTEPAFLLTMTNANKGSIEPMVQCSGISSARGACENKDTVLCLQEGAFHLVKSSPFSHDGKTAHYTVATIRAAAAAVARRQLDSSRPPKVILHTRNPLEIVFDDVMASLADYGVIIPDTKVDKYQFQDLSRDRETHVLILRSMLFSAFRNIQEWAVMKTFIDNPAYDVLFLRDEELGDRLLQPAIMAEMSRHLGLTPDHNVILDGLQASETMYVKRVNPDHITSNDFFLTSSAVYLQYICHLMEMVPMFLETTVQQGYGHEISILTEYCVGFDEEWIVTAGEEIFAGFSETM